MDARRSGKTYLNLTRNFQVKQFLDRFEELRGRPVPMVCVVNRMTLILEHTNAYKKRAELAEKLGFGLLSTVVWNRKPYVEMMDGIGTIQTMDAQHEPVAKAQREAAALVSEIVGTIMQHRAPPRRRPSPEDLYMAKPRPESEMVAPTVDGIDTLMQTMGVGSALPALDPTDPSLKTETKRIWTRVKKDEKRAQLGEIQRTSIAMPLEIHTRVRWPRCSGARVSTTGSWRPCNSGSNARPPDQMAKPTGPRAPEAAPLFAPPPTR